jgi:predicted NAD/FAD-binding protein
LRDTSRVDFSSVAHTNETYDLVIVGAGISGLSAGYFFSKNTGPNSRVLILDNHDDFGGHAKRNEFRHNGKLMVINGGTLNIEAPQRYFEDAKALFHDIGIDLERFQASNKSNHELYRSHDLCLLLIGCRGRVLARTDLMNGCKADTKGARAGGIAPRERDSTICSREIPQWTESH